MRTAATVFAVIAAILAVLFLIKTFSSDPSSAEHGLLTHAEFAQDVETFKKFTALKNATKHEQPFELFDYGTISTSITKDELDSLVKTLSLEKTTNLTEPETGLCSGLPLIASEFAAGDTKIEAYRSTPANQPGKQTGSQASSQNNNRNGNPFSYILLFHRRQDGEACFLLGYRNPEPSAEQKERASAREAELSKLKSKAQSGDREAQLALARELEDKGTTESAIEASQWYRKAAEQGDSKAQFRLGKLMAGKALGKPNYQEAAKWLKQAAPSEPNARLLLGELTSAGLIKGDTVSLIMEAARGRDELAQNALGKEFENKRLDIPEAIYWHKKAADNGSIDSMLCLAHIYEKKHDLKRTLHWYQRAAAGGAYEGLLKEGDIYRQMGNFKQANTAYRKAAVLEKQSHTEVKGIKLTATTECRQADALAAKGNLEEAAKLYREIAVRRYDTNKASGF